MERLARVLIEENKLDKAEKVIDTAMEKMPVHKFGHYSMLIPFIDLYYQLNKPEKARKLASELNTVFQQHLTYYSQYSEEEIDLVFDDIEKNLMMYDQVVKYAIQNDTEAYTTKLKEEYVSYIKLYSFLMEDDEIENVE